MSWFFGSSKAEATRSSQDATGATGSFKPMNRQERQACWTARDQYFACLDRNNILDALKEGDKALERCSKENQAYEHDCATSWVKYFKQKRVADWEKDQKIKKLEAEGAVPMNQAQKPMWKFW